MRRLAQVLVCAAALCPMVGCDGGGGGVEVPKETVAAPTKQDTKSFSGSDAGGGLEVPTQPGAEKK